VDSTVAAVLVHRAMGDRLTNIFVNTGMLRKNEFANTLEMLRDRLKLRVIGVDESEQVSGQTQRRHRSGAKAQDYRKRVHRVFAEEAQKLQRGRRTANRVSDPGDALPGCD